MSELMPLSDLSFAFPWAFLVPILLFVFWLYRMSFPGKSEAIAVAAPLASYKAPKSFRQRLRSLLLPSLLSLTILALCFAAARPQKVLAFQEREERRNIMLVLDLSRSMLTRDFGSGLIGLNRFEGVMTVVREFISKRIGDRIGVVVFGDNAYLQAPLTIDHSIVLELLSQLRVGVAGNGTAMGDGLGLALKRLERVPGNTKAAILLSDGVSTAGSVNPLQAATVAKDLDIVVHTVGIGSSNPAPGLGLNTLLQGSAADSRTLRTIAEDTGGVYFHADDIEGLRLVYDEIDKLEKSEDEAPQREVPRELFWIPLSFALISYFAHLLLSRSLLMRIP